MSLYMQIGLAICCSIGNTFLLKLIAESGAHPSQTVFFRGFTCLAITIVWAVSTRKKLLPNRFGFQIVRLCLAGLALTMLTASYLEMHASSVALISRMDLPLTIIFGGLYGYHSSRRKLTSAAMTIILAIFMAVLFRTNDETLKSYVLAFIGTALIAHGYLFIRTTASLENASVLSSVPALGSMLVGGIWYLRSDTSLVFTSPSVGLACGSGILMFALYQLTREAYQKLSVGKSEFYGLLSAVGVLIIEMLVMGQVYTTRYLLAFAAISGGVVVTIFLDRGRYEQQAQTKVA